MLINIGLTQNIFQYLYADLFHDGHRIDAEISLGAALLEKIGEAKRKRLVPRTVMFSSMDVTAAEESAMVVTAQRSQDKKSAEFNMTWMRARLALMSVGNVCSLFMLFFSI